MNLIIGNGLIGRHLYYLLRDDALLLTRKEVDLSKDSWELPECSTAFICAGVTSTEECERHREESQLVNITNTLKLAEMLKPARVVWISSERVYDGSIPFRKVTDEVCPTTEYGRQKAEAERLLLDLGATVIRFSKVLGWEIPLFEGWIKRLEGNEFIYPYSNVGMSPISVSFAVDILSKIKEVGLFQVSGDRDISYSQIAYHIANQMGKVHLVQPVESKPHPYTTLECNFNVDIPDSWETIEGWCQNRLLTRAQ